MPRTKTSWIEIRNKDKAAGVTRYFGSLCEKHPELGGERRKNNRKCIACHRAYMATYMTAYNRTPARKMYDATARALRARVRKGHISEFATPKWANKTEITLMYTIAKRVSKETGTPHHVDHVIPLKGKLVCGLHVPGNLQLLTAVLNARKGANHR